MATVESGTSYNRYLALAGLSVFMSSYISFNMSLGAAGATYQAVLVNSGTTALGFYQLSVYVVFISQTANNYLWVLSYSTLLLIQLMLLLI